MPRQGTRKYPLEKNQGVVRLVMLLEKQEPE